MFLADNTDQRCSQWAGLGEVTGAAKALDHQLHQLSVWCSCRWGWSISWWGQWLFLFSLPSWYCLTCWSHLPPKGCCSPQGIPERPTEGFVMQVLQNNPNTPFSVGKVLAAEVQDVLSKYICKQTSNYYSHEYEKDPPNSTVCAWCCFKWRS